MFNNTLIKVNSANLASDILKLKGMVAFDISDYSPEAEEAYLDQMYSFGEGIIDRLAECNPETSRKELEWELYN